MAQAFRQKKKTTLNTQVSNEKLTWKSQISYICSRISKNTGIFLWLRRYLSLKQLKQLYHPLIYPYINYAIISWRSASTSNLKKIQVKQNHVVRLIFFATLYGKHTERALLLLNLLDLLSVENIFPFQLLNCQTFLINTFAMPVMFTHTIQDTHQRPISIKNILGLMLGNELHRPQLLNCGRNYLLNLRM